MVSCQASPESPIIINKNNNNNNNNFKSVVYNRNDIPNSIDEKYTKNGVNISFKAQVDAPSTAQFPIFNCEQEKYTIDDLEVILNGLFGQNKLYSARQPTKGELEAKYLKLLIELEEVNRNPSAYEYSAEFVEEEINTLIVAIENAPEADVRAEVERKFIQTDELESFIACSNIDDEIRVINFKNMSLLMYIKNDNYVDVSNYYPNNNDIGPTNLSITKEEALEIANNVLQLLGVSYMKNTAYATGVPEMEQIGSGIFDTNSEQAHLFFYTREEHGIPVTYDHRNSSCIGSQDVYSVPQFYERIEIAVNDTGLASIRWQGKNSITQITSLNEVVSFQDTMSLAQSQISYIYAFSSSTNQLKSAQKVENSNLGDWLSTDVVIDTITLGYMYVPIQNQNTKMQLVPVWDFYGYLQSSYENGEGEKVFRNNKSILTINAINGTIIDRDLGY